MSLYEIGILILLATVLPWAVVILYDILQALREIHDALTIEPSREDLMIERARKDVENFLRDGKS